MKRLKNLKKQAIIFWMTLFLGVVLFFYLYGDVPETPIKDIGYTEFVQKVQNDSLYSVTLKGKTVIAVDKDGHQYKLFTPYPERLIDKLEAQKINIKLEPMDTDFVSKIPLFMPVLIFLVVVMMLYGLARSLNAAGARAMGLGKIRTKVQSEKSLKTRFKDVAGIDEASEELKSIVEFLKMPKKFERLGGKIPKGVLLYGPPGNGKTLLARAIAGEAHVPFLTIAGSDFVEMVVGVGASRVRDLFDQAKKHAPCIVFIDELDAVGRKRSSGNVSGGHEEREQTLNQLLVEMDGFESNKGIIVVAATNRVDVLDSALLRPGRFDRHIPVLPPDIEGRNKILEVHTKNVPLSKDVNLTIIARGTPGFSGADLASLVNEAALYAAKKEQKTVTMEDFEYARDKIIMGAEKLGRSLAAKDRSTIAYHEAGHAVLAYYTKGAHPIHKVTIVPRGYALGMVVQLPEKDEVLMSKEQALANIIVAMGGRVAEQIFFGMDHVTSGASNDIQQATKLAQKMVVEWGLSDETEPTVFRNYSDEMQGHPNPFSEEIMRKNDTRIENILNSCYKRATQTMLEHKSQVESLANQLLEHETLNSEEVKNLFDHNVLPQRSDTPQDKAKTKKKKT